MEEINVDNQHDEVMITEEISVSDTCYMCLKETNDVLACKKCRQKIHTFCGHASKDNEKDTLCPLCFTIENANEDKIDSKIKVEVEAKKMKMN
ncbi:hypothetical protein M0804_004519 [Polistes exclamans]|nr:hypothetical protein M0804_004519 [Polistes exclamans]